MTNTDKLKPTYNRPLANTCNKPQIAIIGCGPAGLGAVQAIDDPKANVIVFDSRERPGGRLNDWHTLNPEMTPSQQIIDAMTPSSEKTNVHFKFDTQITEIGTSTSQQYSIETQNNETYIVDAVIFAGGYNYFDARKKEELGYGLYPRVVTSVDIEAILSGKATFPVAMGHSPRIGLVHCVGSRDEKCNNRYCSRMCCMVGVKQAIELKTRFPQGDILCFYMDLRMTGRGYEELYLQAQLRHGVHFIRGRVSEVSENNDGSLQIKAEDTLMGRPLRSTFDLLVLLVGMEPPQSLKVASTIPTGHDGFALDTFCSHTSDRPQNAGLFWAGACKGPTSSIDAFRDGQSAGLEALRYLRGLKR